MVDLFKIIVYFAVIPLFMWLLTGYSVFLYAFIMFWVYSFEKKIKNERKSIEFKDFGAKIKHILNRKRN